jgi:nitrogen regulatory protein PII
VANDEDVDKIVKVICGAAMTGKAGDGRIFVYTIENTVQIRTGDACSTIA